MKQSSLNQQLHTLRGSSYFKLAKYIDALADFDLALLLSSQNKKKKKKGEGNDGLVERAEVLLFLGIYDAALDDFSEAIRLDPKLKNVRICFFFVFFLFVSDFFFCNFLM